MKVASLKKKPEERRYNLTERIYRQLKNEIFDFKLLPAERFTESEVAERMHASRTPVREALMRLSREGFVSVSFRSGWQVEPFDFEQFEQLYEVRIVLEMEAVKRLCEMSPAPDLTHLKDIWLVPEHEKLSNGPAVCELDEQFHMTLVEATGNRELARIHHDICERLRIVRRIDFTQSARLIATYQEHAEILRAIIKRRSDAASMMLKTHIEASKAEVRKITLHMLHSAREQQHSASSNVANKGENP